MSSTEPPPATERSEQDNEPVRSRWTSFGRAVITPPWAPILVGGAACVVLYAWFTGRHEVTALPASDPSSSPAAVDSYCRDISVHAAALGNLHSIAALILGLVAVTGALLQATQDDGGSITSRLRRPLLFLSAPCTVVAVFLFLRATAANTLASVANSARTGGLDGPAMMRKCAEAWGAWVLSRNDANGVALAGIEESVRGKASELDQKVAAVADKTTASVQQNTQGTDANAQAVLHLVDAILATNRDAQAAAAASARELASRASTAAEAASSTAAAAKVESVRSAQEFQESLQDAQKSERQGFADLVGRKFDDALIAFQAAENASHGYHQAYEIATLLRKHQGHLQEPDVQRDIARSIVNQYSRYVSQADLQKLREMAK